MTPQASVVVATFDRLDLLERCLRSVVSQTCSDFECIVVNDHPPTRGRVDEVVERLADTRFVLLHNEINRGPAASRNRALEAAGSPIIGLLDDDDWWHPGFLEAHVALHRSDPGAVLVYCGYVRDAGPLGLGPKEVQAVAPPADPFREMVSGRFTFASTSILSVKREAMVKVGGYDESLKGFEDWDLACRLLETGRAAAIPAPLAVYTEHRGFRVTKNRSEDFAAIKRKWGRFPEVDGFIHRQQAELEFNSSRSAVFEKERAAGWRHFARFVAKARHAPAATRSLALLLLLNVLGSKLYSRLQSRSSSL